MAVPKRRTSKMKLRSRKATKRYKGFEFSLCLKCSAPKKSHYACPECGDYRGKSVKEVVTS